MHYQELSFLSVLYMFCVRLRGRLRVSELKEGLFLGGVSTEKYEVVCVEMHVIGCLQYKYGYLLSTFCPSMPQFLFHFCVFITVQRCFGIYPMVWDVCWGACRN